MARVNYLRICCNKEFHTRQAFYKHQRSNHLQVLKERQQRRKAKKEAEYRARVEKEEEKKQMAEKDMKLKTAIETVFFVAEQKKAKKEASLDQIPALMGKVIYFSSIKVFCPPEAMGLS